MTPILSIIIPTYNSASSIEPCLKSLMGTANIEIIVVDNNSTDATKQIARAFTDRVLNKGPERHAQRRAGADIAQGQFLLFLDADMQASPQLVPEIIQKLETADAVIIPEMPFGADNYWTQVKCAERLCYAGDDSIEAARAFRAETYKAIGGFSETMISCEDWDLTNRARLHGANIVRTKTWLYHDEGYVTLANICQKKAYYGGKAHSFSTKNGIAPLIKKLPIFRKSIWRGIWNNTSKPHIAAGIFVLVLCTMISGAWGYSVSK